MKLHLNLSLRRALLTALVTAGTLSGISRAGMVDTRYDLQYYMDFARNKGMFSVGATNIEVLYKDGTSVQNPVIPIMPDMSGYGQKMTEQNLQFGVLMGFGGCGLVTPQFVAGAAHVGENPVLFLTEDGDMSTIYYSTGYKSYATDVEMQRLNKIVTEVTYIPMADDAFIRTLKAGDWLWRLGDGIQYNEKGETVAPLSNSNTLGGIVGIDSVVQNAGKDWLIRTNCRQNDFGSDLRTPLDIGHMFGDSGSPQYAWDAENNRFVFVVATSQGTTNAGFNNQAWLRSNPTEVQKGMDSFTVVADQFSGEDTILWGTQDAATGKGLLTQGDVSVEYTGKGSSNTDKDTRGLTFRTSDAEHVQTLELQNSVNMGAGAMTFETGKWKLTEKEAASTFNSAGFVVNKGAELTLDLTATSAEEWRKVGEGTMTIAGSGNNEAALRVGGGTTQYNVSYDDEGNITGCTLGNIGETRLNRTGGYAASSVRLEGGVAILALMQDGQFKTKSVAGDTFTFGNAGGLLNLNGHNLEWGVINQDGSGKGARIGNFTPLGEQTPGLATFTYTGTGTFDGCFMDEGRGEGKAQLAVKYNNTGDGTWILTGNHSNVGGFTVEAGTMKLQGSYTPHVHMTDRNDWTYATLTGSNVTVKSGATFQLSHHALMTGDINVEVGGSFVINQTANATSESIVGGKRLDMSQAGIKALIGNVTLKASGTDVAQMEANISSPVTTIIDGSINLDDPNDLSYKSISLVKKGNGILSVTGAVKLNSVNIEEGGLVIGNGSDNEDWFKWTIGEKGFLAAIGATNIETLLSIGKITEDSRGVLALTADQATQLTGDAITNGLYIGAYGDTPITYGTAGAALSANANGQWLLGGGTGTLQVDFLLTGEHDLIIGNEWSSGTVHLTNTANDFTGDIYIKGMGNMLTYEEGALGSALVNLSYSNALALYEARQLDIIKDGSSGVLALGTNENLDLSRTSLSLGANGEFTYSGTLTVDDMYRFGGSGHLTVDTELDGTKAIEIDGQGTTGSSVTFARENAFTGAIVAGGGLHLNTANSSGDIGIHVGHEDTLANATSVRLQKGAVLYTDGGNMTVNNLTMESGSALRNNGSANSLVLLNVGEDITTSLADGVLSSSVGTPDIHLVKNGKGTLNMAVNSGWSGGLTIYDGKVTAKIIASGDFTSVGGIGSDKNAIYVAEGGTLSLTGVAKQGYLLGGTQLLQSVTGTGTIEFATGGAALFSEQSTSFEGTIKLMGNTRLYVGTHLTTDYYYTYKNNKNAVNNATIDIEDGSQVRIGSGLRYLKANRVSLNTDFVISGDGFKGVDSVNAKDGNKDVGLVHAGCNAGALSIDSDSTVYGDITLKDDASIASWSAGKLLTSVSNWQACTTASTDASYALKGYLGGTVRGRILGEGKTLTVRGNEGMTFTADSVNTFGNLVIANGNGNNDDKFALRLNGGKAVSQTSTALGMGDVTLNGGLILRLAGTGVANNTDVVYTYANDITAGNNATLQSYNITNRLTGTVSMSGSSLNLATADGGVLELAGGIDGSGTLNVGAASVVSLGSAVAPLSAESPQFSGSIVAGAGADITLASSSVLASSTTITGTESLTLRLDGTGDYALGGISGASDLTLHFDFTNTPTADDTATWTTLNSSITAGTTTIALDLNLFNDIETGNYTLISSAGTGTTYQLADTMNERLNLLTNDAGALVLTVDADNRLHWRTGGSCIWNTTDANWYSEAAAGSTTFSSKDNVMLDATGVAAGNSSAARETISLSGSAEVDTLGVQDAAYEVTGSGAITGNSLAVGNGGDLKLSNAGGSTFTEGVVVNDAALTVEGNTVTADVRAEAGGQFTLQKGAWLSGNLTISDAEATISQSTLAGDVTAKGNGKLVLESAAVSGARQLRFEEAGMLSASSGVTLSGAFTFATGQTVLQAEGMSINTGSLSSTAALEVDTLAMSGASLTLTHAAGTTTQIDTITGNGSLNKESAGNLNLGKASLYDLTLKGGGVTTISGTVTVSNHFSLGKETVNLVEGADVTVAHYTSGNTASSQPTQLSIGTGASLTVTGNNDADATNASFLLAHWDTSPSSLKLNGGTLTAEKTSLMMGWDSAATFEATAGTANLKGIRFSTKRGNEDSLILGSAESGSARINLGSAGISGIGTNDKVLLGNGIIGATSDFSITGSGSVAMVATEGSTVFDTDGHKITVSTALTGDGNITKLGEGTLLISGSGSAYAGNIAVNAGALAVDATGKDILTSAASVAVGDGATLDLSALDFTDTTNRISVSPGTSISFADNATVAFGNMEADTKYGVFAISGGVLEGWSDLSASNFIIDGVRLSDLGRVELSLNMTGDFSYSIDRWDLVWNGGQNGKIWNQDESNLVWQTSRPDDSTGELVEMTVGYKNNDNVTFNYDASIQVGETVIANTVTISGNATVSLDGSAVDANRVVIETGSKLKAVYASVLVPVDAFDIAAGGDLEINVPGTPTYTAEVNGEGTITMTGGGTLTWDAADGSLNIHNLNIKDGSTFKSTSAFTASTVNVNNGTMLLSGDVNIASLNLAKDKTVTLWNEGASDGADKTISVLTLGANAILQTNDRNVVTAATTVEKLVLQGDSATLRDQHHSGHIQVNALKLADGRTSATLQLDKKASSANMTVFDLGCSQVNDAGNFVGTIDLKFSGVVDSSSGARSAAVILSHADIARNAVINISSSTSSSNESYLALGINADKTSIAGLRSGSALGAKAKVFSGNIAANEKWSTGNIDNAALRTLTINTAAGTTHDFYGDMLGNLNLVKTGTGTQRFLGASSGFDGSITIQGGTLAFNSAGVSLAERAKSISVSNGANLQFEADTDMTLSNAITGEGTIHKKGTNATVLSGNVSAKNIKVADGTNQGTAAGTLTLSGDTVTANQLYIAYGRADIGSTDGSATFMKVNQVEMGDSVTADATSELSIHKGSTLLVTGDNNGTGSNTNAHKNASFLLAEWNATSSLNVEGTVMVPNAKVVFGDDAGTINITGGTLAAKGIDEVRSSPVGNAINLNLSENGKLILGADGFDTAKSVTATLGTGTVGMTADEMTIAENLVLNSSEGTNFDTTQYAYKTDSAGQIVDITRGTSAGTMTISGNISSTAEVVAKMKVTGNGQLVLTGNATLNGGVEVSDGATLSISDTVAIGNNTAQSPARLDGHVAISQATETATINIKGEEDTPTFLNNSLVQLATGAALTIENMIIAENSRISGAPTTYAARSTSTGAELTLTNSTIRLGNENASSNGTQTTTLPTLQAVGTSGADSALSLQGTASVLSVSTTALNDVVLKSGSTFNIDFSNLLDNTDLTHVDFVALYFDNNSVNYSDDFLSSSATQISGIIHGEHVNAYFLPADNIPEDIGLYFDVRAIPEPTTATLSLLALAALAARRRRAAQAK